MNNTIVQVNLKTKTFTLENRKYAFPFNVDHIHDSGDVMDFFLADYYVDIHHKIVRFTNNGVREKAICLY